TEIYTTTDTLSLHDALPIFGVLRDDVDHAVDGVGPPQRGPGTADDLDPVNVLKWDLLHIPEHPGEEGGVDGTSIDQHQERIGGGAIEAARADRPLAGVDLRDLQVG